MPKMANSDACPRPTADPEGAGGRTEVGVHAEGVGAGHLHEEGDALGLILLLITVAT